MLIYTVNNLYLKANFNWNFLNRASGSSLTIPCMQQFVHIFNLFIQSLSSLDREYMKPRRLISVFKLHQR